MEWCADREAKLPKPHVLHSPSSPEEKEPTSYFTRNISNTNNKLPCLRQNPVVDIYQQVILP